MTEHDKLIQSYYQNRGRRSARAKDWAMYQDANPLTERAIMKTRRIGLDGLRGHCNIQVDQNPIYRVHIEQTTSEKFIWNHGNIYTRSDANSVVCKIRDDDFGKMCVLNFASFKNPGGKFLYGSSAQEESLCHFSNLYPVLASMDDVYEEHCRNLRYGMYETDGLYTPNIAFYNPDDMMIQNVEFTTSTDLTEIDHVLCDVITLAAPNYTLARKYRNGDGAFVNAMQMRIRTILDVANETDVDTLILGAYGCGVFGWDPTVVANLFFQEIMTSGNARSVERFIFPIPDDRNYNAFRDAYEKAVNFANSAGL